MIELVLVHFLLGRIASIPLGIGLGVNPNLVFTLAFGMDLAQIPFFFALYDFFGHKLEQKHFFRRKRDSVSALIKRLRFSRRLIPFVVCLMPMKGGGVWSGTLAAKILEEKRVLSYALLSAGAFIGCWIFYALSVGVKFALTNS